MLGVEMAFDDPLRFELLQAGRQDARCQARQGSLEVLKAARAEAEEIAQDQQRPAVANDIERPGDRTL